jgi:hypothetical protein
MTLQHAANHVFETTFAAHQIPSSHVTVHCGRLPVQVTITVTGASHSYAVVESEARVHERAGGTCRVAGANISRAVRMSKMMYLGGVTVFELDADEWDTLALQTLGE